jgi:hypothetical protein
MCDICEYPVVDIAKPLKKSSYEKNAKHIKKYLANKYNTDEDYKSAVNYRSAVNCRNQFIKYNTDEAYRNKILEKRRIDYIRKKEMKQAI